MAKNQKSYTPEFKQQIVDLHCQAGKGVTELSKSGMKQSYEVVVMQMQKPSLRMQKKA